MKTIILSAAIALLALTSCNDELITNVPTELELYVSEFRMIAAKHNRLVSPYVNIIYQERVMWKGHRCKAYCDTDGMQVTIYAEREYFEYFTEHHPNRIRGIMYHELGHSIGLKHNDGFNLMNDSWTEFCQSTDDPRWNELVENMF